MGMVRRYRNSWSLAWLLGTAVLSGGAAGAPPVGAEEPERGWPAIAGELKQAIAARRNDEARALIEELAATGELRGYQIILEAGITGRNHEVDRHAGAVLVKASDSRVREEVYRALAGARSPNVAIILTAVVARWSDDPQAAAALMKGLESRYQPIVLATLTQILRRDPNPQLFMKPLIDALERRERLPRDRIYYDLRRALRHQYPDLDTDFEVAADWRNFWKAREEGIPLPQASEKSRTRVVLGMGTFFEEAIDSSRVLFVIDVSASMMVRDPVVERLAGGGAAGGRERGRTRVRKPEGKGTGEAEGGDGRTRPAPPPAERARIARAKAELMRTIEGLPQHVHFNVIIFNHEVALMETALVPATPGNKSRAVQFVRALAPSGVTRTDLALKKAFSVPDVDTIYLLTDGAPRRLEDRTIIRNPQWQAWVQWILDMVDELNRFRKVRIHTFGFSQGGLSMKRFCRDLARRNDGRCKFLD